MDPSNRVPLPPSLAGKYELSRELAVGGMGIIWLGRDKVNDRDVVFKFIAPELLGDEETRIRFLNEAKLTAALEHPNIVGLYAAGEEDGTFYIIYEYLDGTNLKTLLEKYGAYRIGQALDILIKVADGIACAHRHKILHRDIKPENILVSPLGDKVKIVDFGIAKSIEDSQKLTQTGFIIGTPEYLSPEQAVGHKATYASDQYALAVLAYEMLTARLPIEDTNTVDLFTKKIRGAWVPIRERRPEIPVELAKIIEKAMATDAAQRYLTVDDYVKALTDFTSRRSTAGLVRPNTKSGSTGAASKGAVSGKGQVPTQRVQTGNTPVVKGAGIDIGGAVKKLVSVVAVVAAVAALLLAAWTFWPKGGGSGGLPRMFGTLYTAHQLDGVALSWDFAAPGSAFVRLQPSGTEKGMSAEKGRFTITLAPGELKGVTSLDLLVKDGGKVSTEVDGVPFVRVTPAADTLSVEVPSVKDSAPLLAYWPAGKESAKKEMALKAHGRGFTAEGVPVEAGEDMVLQVVASSGDPKTPLTFLQKVPTIGSYLEQLEERLGKLETLSLLTSTQGAAAKATTTEDLSKAARKTFDALKAEVSSDAIELLKEPLSSSGVEVGRKLGLFEKVQRLEVLRRMAVRAGFTGKVPELDALLDLPWPVRVKQTLGQGLPGAPKPPEKDREKLMLSTLNQYKTGPIDPTGARHAVVSLKFMLNGIGTFTKVHFAKRAVVYLAGPDELPANIHVQGVSYEIELDAPVLPKGPADLDIESQPVVALVQRVAGFLPVEAKANVISSAGTPTPVPVTVQQ